jgi:hypothetical protein
LEFNDAFRDPVVIHGMVHLLFYSLISMIFGVSHIYQTMDFTISYKGGIPIHNFSETNYWISIKLSGILL